MAEMTKDWGPGVGEWGQAEQLQRLYPYLAYDLVEDPDPYGKASDAGLPIPPQRQYANATEFFAQAQSGIVELGKLGVEQFFVSTRPVQDNDPAFVKHRGLGLAADQVLDCVNEWLAPDQYENHGVQIAEYAKAVYGGTINVNRRHGVRIEVVDNEMGKLATGYETPKYAGNSDERGIMRYDFEDPRLRTAVARALKCIPSSRGSRRELDPCYAEFSLINRRDILAPVFFDYKTSRSMTSVDTPTAPWKTLEDRHSRLKRTT
jgi:hypothetical protein